MSYPYAEHDNGVVLTQPRPGEFERRPMTAGELAAREPALKIAKDIYRHANQAGVCYYEFWRLIADAIDACARPEAPLNEAERLSKKWLAAHPHAMMVVEHAGAMLRDALHPTAPSAPSPLRRSPWEDCMSESPYCRKNDSSVRDCCAAGSDMKKGSKDA